MIDIKVLKIASDTKFYGLQNKYTHKTSAKNIKCGDRINLEIIANSDKINALRYETDACIFCQASASFLAKKIKLFKINSLKKDINNLNKTIKNKDNFLPKKFVFFKNLINYKNVSRLDCIMLPFNALLKAFKQ